MTLQNRVLPSGEITAEPWRGTLMGNRGILHDPAAQRLLARRWQHPHWVICRLSYKTWHREVMQPNTYTELFFLDECTALAAGHRPCGLCRRDAYTRWRAAWAKAHGVQKLARDDRLLHAARVDRARRQIRHDAPIAALPNGTFIQHCGAPHLIWQSHLIRCEKGSYAGCLRRPETGIVTVLTPAPTVATLAAGYRPAVHPSALRA